MAWGWFEAGWLRKRVLEVELEGVPAELDGLRIAHLSDFHLGPPSRGRRACEQAVAWVSERSPDLVCVTGDLVSRTSGLAQLERLLTELGPCFVVLGNHDFADSRDPFSQPIDMEEIEALESATLLGDESVEVELRGCRVQLVGVDPRTYAARQAHPDELVDPDGEPADPALPLPADRPAHPGRLPPGPRRAHARRADHGAAPAQEAAPGTPARPLRRRLVPGRRDVAARLVRARHDVRPVSLLRAAGGDRAGCTIDREWTRAP